MIWGICGLTWNKGSSFMVRYAPFKVDGQIAICAIYIGKGSSQARQFHRAALKDAKVTLGGKTILRNMRFANTVASQFFEAGGVGQSSACRKTSAPWTSNEQAYQVKLEFRSGRYSVEKR